MKIIKNSYKHINHNARYLNHNFYFDEFHAFSESDFVCATCLVTVYLKSSGTYFEIIDNLVSKFAYILSCEEQQIKNILE